MVIYIAEKVIRIDTTDLILIPISVQNKILPPLPAAEAINPSQHRAAGDQPPFNPKLARKIHEAHAQQDRNQPLARQQQHCESCHNEQPAKAILHCQEQDMNRF
ncbi:MAG: hypothetical protein ACOC43_13680 [Desulfohalobiaceae bacterium]